MTGHESKRAAALDEDGMYLVHQTAQPVQEPTLREQLTKIVADWSKAHADWYKANADLDKAAEELHRLTDLLEQQND